jgi:hypothetical protein
VLVCAVAFAGRAPSTRSLTARSPGRLTKATAQYWARRWREFLSPPPDAIARAERLGRDLDRYQSLKADVAVLEGEITTLLARTDGQILTSLPGVAANRARRSPHTVCRSLGFPTPRTSIPPPGWRLRCTSHPPSGAAAGSPARALAERRDALMGIASGLSAYSPGFAERNAELRARGMAPIQARVALARSACRLSYRVLVTQQPFDEAASRRGRPSRGR